MNAIIVCRVCRQEKRVYNSCCVNASICESCQPPNPNPELARLLHLQEAAK